MANCAHTSANYSPISPLSIITTRSSSDGGSFKDANNFSFLMDADVSTLMDWHRNVGGGCGSDPGESSSKHLDENSSSNRRLQDIAIARPSNPSPPSFSSQSSSNHKNCERETYTSLSPLELIQQSRAYRHRPPHHIYVRHCHGPSSPLQDYTDTGEERRNQQQPSPQLLQQEFLLLIKNHQALRTSLVTIDEEATAQKLEMLRTLAAASGDAKNVTFAAVVVQLGKLREERRQHVNSLQNIELILKRWMGDNTLPNPSIFNKYISNENLDGQWFTLTKPTYTGCLGFNDDGDPLYRLGRMSFEMFFPGDLICAIQAVFNPIMNVAPPSSKGPSSISVPKTLQEEVQRALEKDSDVVLKTYQ